MGVLAPSFSIFWIRPDQVIELATELMGSFNSVEKYDHCYNELFSGPQCDTC